MRRASTLALLVPLLALAACGSSSKGGSTTGATSGASSTTSVSASVSTSTSGTAPTPPTTVTGAGRPRCVAADLALSFLGQQGATGHGLLGFSLRNTSPHSCHTFGYPGIVFLNRSGRALPTVSTRTTRDFFGRAPVVSLVLKPGQSASFRIGVTHGMSSPVGCTTAHGLQVIPPDDTATLRTQIPGGAYECRTATLSPLRPGATAYP